MYPNMPLAIQASNVVMLVELQGIFIAIKAQSKMNTLLICILKTLSQCGMSTNCVHHTTVSVFLMEAVYTWAPLYIYGNRLSGNIGLQSTRL